MSKNIVSERYGRDRLKSQDRKMAITVGAVVLVSFLIWAIMFVVNDSSRITYRDIAYEVIDEFSTSVTFEVSRNIGQEVACDITILAESFAIVGFLTVDIAASENRSTVISTTVQTTELGVTGLVDGCR